MWDNSIENSCRSESDSGCQTFVKKFKKWDGISFKEILYNAVHTSSLLTYMITCMWID